MLSGAGGIAGRTGPSTANAVVGGVHGETLAGETVAGETVTGGASVVVQSASDQAVGGRPSSPAEPLDGTSGRVCDVHWDPFHQRSPMADSGSRYQPA
jgi:hypothetical protein